MGQRCQPKVQAKAWNVNCYPHRRRVQRIVGSCAGLQVSPLPIVVVSLRENSIGCDIVEYQTGCGQYHSQGGSDADAGHDFTRILKPDTVRWKLTTLIFQRTSQTSVLIVAMSTRNSSSSVTLASSSQVQKIMLSVVMEVWRHTFWSCHYFVQLL